MYHHNPTYRTLSTDLSIHLTYIYDGLSPNELIPMAEAVDDKSSASHEYILNAGVDMERGLSITGLDP
jgi:hypothetical protein